ncbi:MAG: PQQ-dependent sugar dehydrogenase [Planctomycetes bacterium]|nr:PQQ-dependent sugar dehydrogenase [Planctomycetota bacterium]
MQTSAVRIRALLATLTLFAITSEAIANTPPSAPFVTEPATDGQIVNPEDVHMECSAFADVDVGDTHVCSDWEIWTLSPAQLVWRSSCLTGVERVHTHLGDGIFQGAYTGRTSLLPTVNYLLRVRHKDSSGDAATQWSLWGGRYFTTGSTISTFPLELEDIGETPAPALRNAAGQSVDLPADATPSTILIESATAQLLLEIRGDAGTGNLIINPTALSSHVDVRVHLITGSALLSLPETDISFPDDHGDNHTIYLPAINLAATQHAYFWVTSNGSTYVGQANEISPVFTTLARTPAVPWTALQPGYKVDLIATGFQLPVNIAFIPNTGSDLEDPFFYVTELYGAIKVVLRNGSVSTYASNLLNYTPTGAFPGSGEQGLAGIAVDPVSGDVFAGMLYDATPPNGAHYPKIVRFHSNDGGLSAASQTTILDMAGETQGQSHQISNFSIGPDGKLYVHMGDGFDSTTAQNLSSYRGKILRVNLDGTAPNDNPFYDASNGINSRDYVYAYGVRNPFGGAWRAADNTLYEVENGPSVDRIVKVVAGRNYLWNGSDASMANFALYNWNPAHGPVNMAFIQPESFGGSGFPAPKMGSMFISESGPTWATGQQALGKRIVEFTLNAAGAITGGPTSLVEYNGVGKATCVGLAAGPDGLYFTDLYRDTGYSSPIDGGAHVLRVKFVSSADFSSDVTRGLAPLAVQFSDASTSASPTAWHWRFGDGYESTDQNPLHTYQHDGVYDVTLTVTGADGITVAQKQSYITVGPVPSVALIGGTLPPSAADAAFANHLRQHGFDVTAFDDEPANRPSAAALGAQFDLVAVSSTITSSNVAGQFRDVAVPLVFWEQALLRTDREALADFGVSVSGTTQVNVVDTSHPITSDLSIGNKTVFNSGANMSVGQGNLAANADLLATRAGAAGDFALLACDSGDVLLGGYVAPHRRVFFFIEDSSWNSIAADGDSLIERSICWAIGSGAPSFDMPADQLASAGDSVTLAATVTSSPPASLQWRRGGAILLDDGRIHGVNSPVLTIESILPDDAGVYELAAESPCGTATSPAVTVEVRIKGDANCDQILSIDDVEPFVQAIVDPTGYAADHPGCSPSLSDMNTDSALDAIDVSLFAEALLN